MKQTADGYKLTSGREFYANNHIVGISPDLSISEGYDGGIDDEKLQPRDRKELALYMIGLWTQFALKETT